MSYAAVEHALALTLRQIENLNSDNVQAGHSRHVPQHPASVRLTSGSVARKASGIQSVQSIWQIHADCFVRTSDETLDDDRREVIEMAGALVSVVDVYPTLGSFGLTDVNAYIASEQITKVQASIPSEPTLERLGRDRYWVLRVNFRVFEDKTIVVDRDANFDTPAKVDSRRYRIRLPSEVHVSSEQPDSMRQGDLWIESEDKK